MQSLDSASKQNIVVSDVHRIASDVVELTLASPDESPLPIATAGSHIDLWLPNAIVRQYSVAEQSAGCSRYVIAVKRGMQSRGGSAFIFDEMKKGAVLDTSGPRNHFQLDERAESYLLISGGIGVTPIIPMTRRLTELNKVFAVHYLNRSWSSAIFLDLLRRKELEPHVHCHFSDTRGRADLGAMLTAAAGGTQTYMCGPQTLIADVLEKTKHWPSDSVKFEQFFTRARVANCEKTCQVELARSGKLIEVAQDESILEALSRENVSIDAICNEGVCRSCMVPVLGGGNRSS